MSTTTDDQPAHVMLELGFGHWVEGDEVHGSAPIVPELFVPGTEALRVSVLATFADMVAGWSIIPLVTPRVPITLELDVHTYGPVEGITQVNAVGRVAKAGRSVLVPTVEFTDGDGSPIGFAAASFMVAPDPNLQMPDVSAARGRQPGEARLSAPLAERLGLERRALGEIVVAKREDTTNASQTLNGGVIAIAAEEAALDLAPGRPLESIALRYLQPVRQGPAVARAEVRAGLGRVEVRDEGAEGRLSVLATTRSV